MKLTTVCVGLALLAGPGLASAAAIKCSNDTTKNYMEISDTQAAACLGSGGPNENINGNPATDDFLTGGGTAAGWVDWVGGSASYTQDPSALTGAPNQGTWSITSALAPNFQYAIGFKFGTGNTLDNWFVYLLKAGVTSGQFDIVPVLMNANGVDGALSHVQLYRNECLPTEPQCNPPVNDVPEPATLGLLGLGLLGLGLRRRKS